MRSIFAPSRADLTRASPSLSQRVARLTKAAASRSRHGARPLVVAAAADKVDGDEISELLRGVPQKFHKRIFAELWNLQKQVVVVTKTLADKADELTAKTEQLHNIKQQLASALFAAGVVNACSFLEYVAKQWEEELPGMPGKMKHTDIFVEGLRKRPELVECLRREVPTWAPASMGTEQTVENMAANLESIILDAKNNIHTFHATTGLTLCKTVHSGPTVAALACLATNMGVPHMIVKGDTFIEQDNNTVTA